MNSKFEKNQGWASILAATCFAAVRQGNQHFVSEWEWEGRLSYSTMPTHNSSCRCWTLSTRFVPLTVKRRRLLLFYLQFQKLWAGYWSVLMPLSPLALQSSRVRCTLHRVLPIVIAPGQEHLTSYCTWLLLGNLETSVPGVISSCQLDSNLISSCSIW